MPVILLGNMWAPLIKWLEKYPIKNKLMNKEDLNSVFLAKNSEEAMKMISQAHEHYKKGDKNICLNYKRYKLY